MVRTTVAVAVGGELSYWDAVKERPVVGLVRLCCKVVLKLSKVPANGGKIKVKKLSVFQ